MNNLILRTIFGLLYISLLTSSLWRASYGELGLFLATFSLLAFIGIWEYSALAGVHRTSPLRVIMDGLAAAYLVSAATLVHSGRVYGVFLPFVPYLIYLLYVAVRSLYSGRSAQPAELSKILFGQIYVALPLALIGLLPKALVLVGLCCIWANDTGAYVSGSMLGRTPLFPSLSPKKSWEGFAGGVVASVLVAVGFFFYLKGEVDNIFFALPLRWIFGFVLIGVIVSVASTWGDLFESMLKRNAGVKDSGKIIPGHGGILDRIDSILFVFPALSLL